MYELFLLAMPLVLSTLVQYRSSKGGTSNRLADAVKLQVAEANDITGLWDERRDAG